MELAIFLYSIVLCIKRFRYKIRKKVRFPTELQCVLVRFPWIRGAD